MKPRIEPFSDPDLPALAAYWNEAFRPMRNFWPVTAEVLRARILLRRTAVEVFDPRGLLLAWEGDRVIGIAHAGVLPEAACRALDPGWSGGTRGYVALLHVLPDRRRGGIGAALWLRGQEGLAAAGCREVFVDGQGLNPFYGNCDGPATPFFGTPEGISLPAEDAETQGFLARRGHRPQALGRTLERAVEPGAGLAPPGSGEWATVTEFLPELGLPLAEGGAFRPAHPFVAVVALAAGRVVGLLGAYEMVELGRGHWGIYQLAVEEDCRGRGLGKALLPRALAELQARGARTVETLTLPEHSPAALRLYQQGGFVTVAEWAIY